MGTHSYNIKYASRCDGMAVYVKDTLPFDAIKCIRPFTGDLGAL